jgi:ZIP family zinc transporter
MSTPQILLLGAIAGATIFLGLPIGRLQGLSSAARVGLSSLATGILIFLLWDVLTGGVEPIEAALDNRNWGTFTGLAALGLAGFALGLMSLVYYAEWLRRRARRHLTAPRGVDAGGAHSRTMWFERMTAGSQLALLIAIGIGVHNFGEGLAIGQAASADQISLAVTLIVGFGLHNATEGFGICGPMSAEGTQPSWRYLVLLGVVGGGPTFLGTLLGQAWTSDAVSVLFFTVAAGSILYVVQELFAVNRLQGHAITAMWLTFAGIALGFATDFVVSAAGV